MCCPAGQFVHDEAPGPDFLFTAHGVHVEAPDPEYFPAAQEVHDAALPEEYFPAGQGVHDVAFAAEYFPPGHDAHELPLLYVPAVQVFAVDVLLPLPAVVLPLVAAPPLNVFEKCRFLDSLTARRGCLRVKCSCFLFRVPASPFITIFPYKKSDIPAYP